MLHGIPPVPIGGSPPAVGKYARAIMCCMMLPAMSTQRRGARARSRRSSSPHGLGEVADAVKERAAVVTGFRVHLECELEGSGASKINYARLTW